MTQPENGKMRMERQSLHSRHLSESKASSIFQSFFLVLGIIFLTLLSIGSTIFTVVAIRNPPEEHAIVATSGLIPTCIGVLAWFAIVCLLSKARIVPRHQTVERIAFIIGTILSATWVFIANCGPAYDSFGLSCAAFALGDRATVPNEFATWYDHGLEMWGIDPVTGVQADYSSYMERFPHQIPFLLILRGCQLIAGNKFYTLFELINAVANGISWFLLCRIAYELSNDERSSVVALGLCVTFTPLVYYSTFIYGNLIGQVLGLGAWLLCILACKSDTTNTRQFFALLICSLLLALSTLTKQTMQIASIAFAICIILYSLKTKRIVYLPIMVLPFLLTSMLMNPLLKNMEIHTGANLHDAPPKTTWIVMGIGGGSERSAELGDGTIPERDLEWPGYFDAYIWGNPQAEGFSSWEDFNAHYLKARLHRFAQNPAYMVKFFARKIAIEWLEPTCECFLMSNHIYNPNDPWATYMCDTSRQYTTFAPSFYYGIANTISVILADIFQTITAIGALIWCIDSLKKEDVNLAMQLFALILVLGGVLLYILWENKTQYILPFWFFLLPYAACGWSSICKRVVSISKSAERF